MLPFISSIITKELVKQISKPDSKVPYSSKHLELMCASRGFPTITRTDIQCKMNNTSCHNYVIE